MANMEKYEPVTPERIDLQSEEEKEEHADNVVNPKGVQITDEGLVTKFEYGHHGRRGGGRQGIAPDVFVPRRRDLEGMNATELRSLAKEMGIEGESGSKENLLEAFEQKRAGTYEEPLPPPSHEDDLEARH